MWSYITEHTVHAGAGFFVFGGVSGGGGFGGSAGCSPDCLSEFFFVTGIPCGAGFFDGSAGFSFKCCIVCSIC